MELLMFVRQHPLNHLQEDFSTIVLRQDTNRRVYYKVNHLNLDTNEILQQWNLFPMKIDLPPVHFANIEAFHVDLSSHFPKQLDWP